MLFKTTSRTGPEQVFVAVRNTSGGSISANAPVFWETDAVTDGNAVSQNIDDTSFSLFAGITDSAMSDDDYGLIQVYGFRESCFASAASAGVAIGIPFIPVDGEDYLTNSTSSAAATFHFVTLMETIAADAANSAVLEWNVFIRAL